MKNHLLFFALLAFFGISRAQDVVFSVEAQFNGEAIRVDSIRINNLSNGTSLLLIDLPDQTSYQVNLSQGELYVPNDENAVHDVEIFQPVSIAAGEVCIQNMQNDFEKIDLAVYSLSGVRVYSHSLGWAYGETKKIGINRQGIFVLVMKSPQGWYSFKVTGVAGSGNVQIESLGGGQRQLKAKPVDSGFSFSIGDSLEILVYRADYYADPVIVVVNGDGNIVINLTEPAEILKDERDDKEYAIVTIGDQIWMAENLAFLPQVNASAETSYASSRYYVYGYEGGNIEEAKNAANYVNYGVLYNWPAAATACPSGWRLPSETDWMILERYIGLSEDELEATSWRGKNEGKTLKANAGWESNGFGTDDFGFAALPGGICQGAGKFYEIGTNAYWWTATEESSDQAWFRKLNAGMRSIYRERIKKSSGISVRCLKSDFTVAIPSVKTFAAEEVTSDAATLKGQVSDDGGAQITERGFYWSATNPTPDFDDQIAVVDGTTGSYSIEINGLETNSTYYFRSYATNSEGTAMGEVLSFETLEETVAQLPVVAVQPATNVTESTATLHGTIIHDGGSELYYHGFFWSMNNPDPGFDNLLEIVEGSDSIFSVTLTDLQLNTTYYFRTMAANSAGTGVSEVLSFTTLDDPNASVPTVKTSISEVSSSLVTMRGNVLDDGNADIQERGFFWSENMFFKPDESKHNKVVVDGTVGQFRYTMENLSPGQVIWFIAYAKNKKGMGYGEAKVSTIGSDPNAGVFWDDRDEKMYGYVRIGEQVWSSQNMAYLPEVSPADQISQTSPYYYVYNYNGTNVTQAKSTQEYKYFGVLYNLTAALDACPAGWHLPSDDEWKQLELFLGMSSDVVDEVFTRRGTDQGKQLKSTLSWAWLGGGTGTDIYGFKALGGGYNSGGFFQGLQLNGEWWSATQPVQGVAYVRILGYDYSDIWYNSFNGKWAVSVRCLKDQ